MIYAALMWPDAKDDSLWSLALSHAAYLYNHIPKEVTGIAPIESSPRLQVMARRFVAPTHGAAPPMY